MLWPWEKPTSEQAATMSRAAAEVAIGKQMRNKRRVHVRSEGQNWDAAESRNTLGNWGTLDWQTINSILASNLEAIRARARDAAKITR